MPRYYFDLRDNDTFQPDDVGVDLPSFEVAKKEATRALTEIALAGAGQEIRWSIVAN